MNIKIIRPCSRINSDLKINKTGLVCLDESFVSDHNLAGKKVVFGFDTDDKNKTHLFMKKSDSGNLVSRNPANSYHTVSYKSLAGIIKPEKNRSTKMNFLEKVSNGDGLFFKFGLLRID